MREFNVTGLCIPSKHYMADISEKIRQIMAMVEKGQYFTINRARQYGKTTTLWLLDDELAKQGETDKTSNNLVFLRFIGMLRDKYLERDNRHRREIENYCKVQNL